MMAALLLLMGEESGGELVGCLFSDSTYVSGARQEPEKRIHGKWFAVSLPPFRLG